MKIIISHLKSATLYLVTSEPARVEYFRANFSPL